MAETFEFPESEVGEIMTLFTLARECILPCQFKQGRSGEIFSRDIQVFTCKPAIATILAKATTLAVPLMEIIVDYQKEILSLTTSVHVCPFDPISWKIPVRDSPHRFYSWEIIGRIPHLFHFEIKFDPEVKDDLVIVDLSSFGRSGDNQTVLNKIYGPAGIRYFFQEDNVTFFNLFLKSRVFGTLNRSHIECRRLGRSRKYRCFTDMDDFCDFQVKDPSAYRKSLLLLLKIVDRVRKALQTF